MRFASEGNQITFLISCEALKIITGIETPRPCALLILRLHWSEW